MVQTKKNFFFNRKEKFFQIKKVITRIEKILKFNKYFFSCLITKSNLKTKKRNRSSNCHAERSISLHNRINISLYLTLNKPNIKKFILCGFRSLFIFPSPSESRQKCRAKIYNRTNSRRIKFAYWNIENAL